MTDTRIQRPPQRSAYVLQIKKDIMLLEVVREFKLYEAPWLTHSFNTCAKEALVWLNKVVEDHYPRPEPA